MPTTTTNLSFNLSVVGADSNDWGGYLNSNWTTLDGILWGSTTIRPDLSEGNWEIGGVAVTATAAELNTLDGITATVSELNTLDGITATVTELNYTDGVTSAIQTQLDAKQPLDATLTALAGLSTGASKIPYSTGTDTFGQLDLLDEDDFASDSATGLPTQQSVKAYVDAAGWKLVHVENRLSSGVDGGTAANGWNNRGLNTEVTNEVSGASLSANILTLPAGTYLAFGEGPAFNVNGTQVQIYNSTDGAAIISGSGVYSNGSAVAISQAWGVFTLASSKGIRLRQYCEAGKSTNGLGIGVSSGVSSVHGRLMVWKLS